MTELQSSQRRSYTAKTIFGLLLAVVMVAAFATAGSAENTGTPRSGELHVTKECSQYSGQPRWVLHDHRVEPERDPPRHEGHLHQPSRTIGSTTRVDSDLFLDGPGNNDAYGHVELSSRVTVYRPAHVLRRDRPVQRVPRGPRRHLRAARRHPVCVGRNVQLHPARPRQISRSATRSHRHNRLGTGPPVPSHVGPASARCPRPSAGTRLPPRQI